METTLLGGDASNYDTKLRLALTGSEKLPDIFPVYGTQMISDMIESGQVKAIDDDIEKYMPDRLKEIYDKYPETFYPVTKDGKTYGIACTPCMDAEEIMVIRQDWLDALEMDVPTNWDEWVELWRAIKANDLNGNGDPNDEIPLALEQGSNGERSMASLLNAFGIRASSDCQFCVLDDGTYTMVYEHPRYREFLEAVQGLFAEGLILSLIHI